MSSNRTTKLKSSPYAESKKSRQKGHIFVEALKQANILGNVTQDVCLNNCTIRSFEVIFYTAFIF
jgi:hypothetical protein